MEAMEDKDVAQRKTHSKALNRPLLVSVLAICCIAAGTAIGIVVQSPSALVNAASTSLSAADPATATPTPVAANPPAGAARSGCGSARCGQTAQRGCCGSGAGRSAGTADPARGNEQLRDYLTSVYTERLGPGVAVEVKDFGCHQEAEVTLDGKPVVRLSISGDTIREIS